jgi:hypothetical protein
MSSQRSTLTRLPELGEEVIRHDIGKELEKLKEAPSWQRETGRSSETLVKSNLKNPLTYFIINNIGDVFVV